MNTLGVQIAVLRDRPRSSSHPDYISKYHPKENRRKPLVPCSVEGVEYTSIADASGALGISVTLTRNRPSLPRFSRIVCVGIPKKEVKATGADEAKVSRIQG